MESLLYYLVALVALAASYGRDKQKTKQALIKAWKSFSNIMPDFAFILLLIGVLLTVVSPAMLMRVMGADSGWLGAIIAALAGSITLIPGFIAFPLARAALDMGAGMLQIGVFVSTLMMVGVVTAPMEARYFNRRAMWIRNGTSLLYSFAVGMALAKIVG